MQSEDYKIEELKHLLLNEDREMIAALKSEIDNLKKTLNTEKELEINVGPIIKAYLANYTEEIPEKLGPTITQSLKNEIANSKNEVVDALYPILGKMIKKYLQKEFEILSEKINSQIKRRFSIKGFKRKIKSLFTGIKEESLIINDLSESKIEQILIIEKHSGILKGSYSNSDTIDKDVLSAMLTAIKSFVEEALKTGNENLESIEYGLYNIHIQNFNSYYVAAIIHGVYDVQFQESIRERINEYSAKHYKSNVTKDKISKSLETYFSE